MKLSKTMKEVFVNKLTRFKITPDRDVTIYFFNILNIVFLDKSTISVE